MTTHIDTISLLLDKVRAAGADSADAVMFDTVDVSTSTRLQKPEMIERSESKALGLRAFVGSRQAIVSTTDTHPNTLSELAEQVVAMAKAAPPDTDSTLAPASLYAASIPELELFDGEEPTGEWLAQQCMAAEETALANQGITNSEGADASFGLGTTCLAIAGPQGIQFAHSYRTSYYSLSISVVAGTGTGMERDYDFSSTRHKSDLATAESLGNEAARRALLRLNPRKIPTCKVPVVFDPRISRSLVGVLSGAISGSSIARGSSFLKHALHTRIFPEHVCIIDDPHRLRGLGSRPFDGEGVANRKRTIIDKGELTTWLLDMRTANKLKLETTGHAARGIASPPSPSATNIYMDKGSVSPEALIKDIKQGLYVTDTFGMGINTVTGDYSQGAAGLWIENGQIAYPVSEITIAGHLRDMFASATPANDLVFRYATNAPTLRIDGMTIAGA
jgi:PmbA protein